MSKPNSFSEGLQEVAKFLDLSDRLALDVARSVGSDYVPGSAVQDDLRSMALWMDAHPDALVSQANAYFLALVDDDETTEADDLTGRSWFDRTLFTTYTVERFSHTTEDGRLYIVRDSQLGVTVLMFESAIRLYLKAAT